MVFSSVPIYLDPPNWQQQQQIHQQGGGGGGGSYENNNSNNNNHHLPPPQSPAGAGAGGGGGGTGSIKPGSMTDRARMAKIPQPEAALKCPRCESTNTKFCYFNNYSLTQPRHFCKTCRRYWTRGGALRNVPVGGGCRRNKRSKGSRSKSPATGSDHGQAGANSSSTSSMLPSSSTSCSSDMIGHFPPQRLPFLTHLNHLSEYGNSGDIGLNFGGIQPSMGGGAGTAVGPCGGRGSNDMDFQIGGAFAEQWRLQQGHQFPFLNGMYSFDAEAGGIEPPPPPPPSYSTQQQLSSKALDSAMAAVKVEDNNHQQAQAAASGLNLSRNFLGISGSDHSQYWGGGGGGGGGNANAWTDLTGFTNSTSSTRHNLL